VGWDAFISYSHAADGRLAPAIQSGLQRFMRPWYRRRALRVFRDETGLAVDPALWSGIVGALEQSRFFILFASPEAARSRWVNREIEYWRAKKRVEHILPVVTDGGWVWDDAHGDFDWARSTATPPALKGAFVQEPRHLDLCWAHSAERIDARNPKFLDAIAELAAPIHGKAKDELVGEDIRLRRRARRLAWGAISGLALLTAASLIAAAVAVVKSRIAEARRVEAVAQRLAVQSTQLAERPTLRFQLAAEGYRMKPGTETARAVYAAVGATPELSGMMRHHLAPVWSVAIVPNRDLIVSGDKDGRIIAASRETGNIVSEFAHPLGAAITCLLPDPKGDSVAVATTSGVFQLDLGTFAVRGDVASLGPSILSCSHDPTGPRVAVAAMGGWTGIWNLDADRLERWAPAAGSAARAVAYAPDGGRLAIGDARGTIRLWSLESARPLWTAAAAHAGDVLSLDFSPDGSQIVSGGDDGSVKTWRAADGAPGLRRSGHTGAVWKVKFSRGYPSGSYIGSVGTEGDIAWLSAAWAESASFPATWVHEGRINDLAFADDGSYATGGDDKVVAYFDPNRQSVIGGRSVSMGGVPSVLVLDPGGDRVAAAYGKTGRIEIYDLETLERRDGGFEVGAAVTASAAHPKGGAVALGTADGAILLWRSGAAAVRHDAAHTGAVVDLAYAPDGASLFTIGEDHLLKSWRVEGGELRDPKVFSDQAMRALSVDPTGRLLAFGCAGGGVGIVEPASGKVRAQLRMAPAGPANTAIAFDVSGTAVGDACGGLGETGGRRDPPAGPAVTAIAFDGSGTALFVGDAYGGVGRWQTDGWRMTALQQGHQGEVSAIAVSPRDGRVLTTGRDGGVRAWNAPTLDLLDAPPSGHRGPIRALVYDPRTRIVATGGLDGRVIARRIETSLWVAEGCRLFDLFGRPFTPEEITGFHLDGDSPGPCPSRNEAGGASN
jgi:WD40 repeat protein